MKESFDYIPHDHNDSESKEHIPLETVENTFQSEVLPSAHEMFTIASHIEETLQSNNAISAEKKSNIKTRLYKTLQTTIRETWHIASFVGVIAGGITALEASNTYKAVTAAAEQGIDAETMRVVQLVSGADTISDAEILAFTKHEMQLLFSDKHITVPVNFEKFTVHELQQFLETSTGMDADSFSRMIQSLKSESTLSTHGKKYAHAMNEIIQKSGNPKMRFIEDDPVIASQLHASGRAAYYHAESHTIYLSFASSPDSLRMEAFHELSHAKQFSKKPIASITQGYKDIISTFLLSKHKHISLDSAQKALYEKEGSNEYEAEKILAPQLEKEFQKMVQEQIHNIPQVQK